MKSVIFSSVRAKSISLRFRCALDLDGIQTQVLCFFDRCPNRCAVEETGFEFQSRNDISDDIHNHTSHCNAQYHKNTKKNNLNLQQMNELKDVFKIAQKQ